jgi:hypothetical protein
VIAALLAYLPWLAFDVLVEAAVAARCVPRAQVRFCVRFAAAAAMATHGLATTLRLLLPHDVVMAELVWAAIDYVLWRTLAGMPKGLSLWTNLAASTVAMVGWFLMAS